MQHPKNNIKKKLLTSLKITCLLFGTLFIVLIIYTARVFGGFPDFPEGGPIDAKGNICIVFGVDGGSGSYLNIFSMDCHDYYEAKNSGLTDLEIGKLLGQYDHGDLNYIDRIGGPHCVAVTRDKNRILLTESQACLYYLNFHYWRENKQRLILVKEDGQFVVEEDFR